MMNNTTKSYCVSWSPKYGEATYSNIFRTEEERAKFIKGITEAGAKGLLTWENEYKA